MFGLKFVFAANILYIFPNFSASLLTENYSTPYDVNLSELTGVNAEVDDSNHELINFEKPPLLNHEDKANSSSNLREKVFIPVALTTYDLNDAERQNKSSSKGTPHHSDDNDDDDKVDTDALDAEKPKNLENNTGYFAEAGNSRIIIKNGKKYKVTKVRKRIAIPKKEENEKFFQQLSSSSSSFPLTWSQGHKIQGNHTDNMNFWSKLNTIQKEENLSKESLESGGSKIKKLLNLFTIVKFDNKECFVNGMRGVCLHRIECEQKGMKYASTCASDFGVCCYHGITCGEQSNQTLFYLSEDQFVDNMNNPRICTFTINKSDPDIIQFRVEFLDFQLKGPTNGTCLHDRLVFTGQSSNAIVPEICGVNTGQHLYVHVHDSDGPFNLNLITMEENFPRSFRLKVMQLKYEDEFSSPKNCLQYFIQPVGNIQTFNYVNDYDELSDGSSAGYFNNLNYAICIKRLKGICSISYENEDVMERNPTFQFTNMDTEGESLLPPLQAGAETFDCPDDYIIISGLRLCGEKLNDVSVDVDLTKNYPVTDTSNGPFIVFVRTDSAINGRGLNIRYIQNPCST